MSTNLSHEPAVKRQVDVLREFLMRRPRRWVAMPRLAKEIGAFAVHSRVAQVRREAGITIVNKQRNFFGQRHSFYRYLPTPISP